MGIRGTRWANRSTISVGRMKLAITTPIIVEKRNVINGIGPHPLRDFPRTITVCTIWWAMYGSGVSMNMIEISTPRVAETILLLVD